jgi:hypothetical protein
VLAGGQHNVKNRLTLQRFSCPLTRPDLRRLCEILQERARTAADHEVANFNQGQQTTEHYEANKILLSEAFVLRITVTGTNGQELYGTISEVFDSPNFPDEVKSVYVNSSAVLPKFLTLPYFRASKLQMAATSVLRVLKLPGQTACFMSFRIF